jgi:hypothetical protein
MHTGMVLIYFSLKAALTGKGEITMVRFYDPRDEADQLRVEGLLRRAGIEYFLRRSGEPGIGPLEIVVAEEDIPAAEELLQRK